METLRATFGIDKGARGFGERGNGQLHVGHIGGSVCKGCEGHDKARLLERSRRGRGIGRVQRGFGVQQQQRLHGLGEHLLSTHAPGARQGVDQLRANTVGRCTQIAHAGTHLLAQPLRQRQQRRRLGVVHGGIAQQQRLALAHHQRGCDGLGVVAGHRRHGWRHTVDGGHFRRHGGQRLHPRQGRRHQTAAHGHRPVVGQRMQAVHSRPVTRSLPNALRKQGVVFPQEAADDEHAASSSGVLPTTTQSRSATGRPSQNAWPAGARWPASAWRTR